MREISYFFLISIIWSVIFTNNAMANNVPTFTSPNSFPAAENQQTVGTVQATDGDGDTLTYILTGGADKDHFAIDPTTGVFTFITAQDFERPLNASAASNKDYVVQVRVDDGKGGNATQTITVNLTNVVEVLKTTVPSGTQTAVKDTLTAIDGRIIVEEGDGLLKEVVLSVNNGTIDVKGSGNVNPTRPSSGVRSSLSLKGTLDEVNKTLASLTYQGKPSFVGRDQLKVTLTNNGPASQNTDTDTIDIKVVTTLVQPCDWKKKPGIFVGDGNGFWGNYSVGPSVSYSLVQYNLADKESTLNAKALGAGLSFRYYTTYNLTKFGNEFLKRPLLPPNTPKNPNKKYAHETEISDIPAGCRAQTADLTGGGNKIASWWSLSPTVYAFQEENANDLGVQFALNLGILNDIISIGVGWNLSGRNAGEWFMLVGPSYGFRF